MLAGISVDDMLALKLAGKLRDAGPDDTAEKHQTAYDRDTKILALTIPDRESIVRCLGDWPAEFTELRAVLLKEHAWRVREGLTG